MILNQAKLIELAALLTMLNGVVRDAMKMTIERADKFLRKDVICAIIDIANRGENAEGFIPGLVALLQGELPESGESVLHVRSQLATEIGKIMKNQDLDGYIIYGGLSYLRTFIADGSDALKAKYMETIKDQLEM